MTSKKGKKKKEEVDWDELERESLAAIEEVEPKEDANQEVVEEEIKKPAIKGKKGKQADEEVAEEEDGSKGSKKKGKKQATDLKKTKKGQEEEEEEEEGKSAKGKSKKKPENKKKQTATEDEEQERESGKKKQKKKGKRDEEQEENEEEIATSKKDKKNKKNKAQEEEVEAEEEGGEEETEETVGKKGGKKTSKKKKEDDLEEEQEEPEIKTTTKKGKKQKQKTEEDEEAAEEETIETKGSKKDKNKAGKKKGKVQEEDEEDVSVGVAAKKGKKASKQKAKEEEEEEVVEEEQEAEEVLQEELEEEEGEEEEEETSKPKKKKAGSRKKQEEAEVDEDPTAEEGETEDATANEEKVADQEEEKVQEAPKTGKGKVKKANKADKKREKRKKEKEREAEEVEEEGEEEEDNFWDQDTVIEDLTFERIREMIDTLDEETLEKKGLPPPYVRLARFTPSAKSSGNDIKVDNINISVPGQILLNEATLTISYGKKYGLVGRNYSGKTTLMKQIANRELPIPKHLTVLLVEQEVQADETPSLQKVLAADIERAWLLAEEQKMLAERYQDDTTEGEEKKEGGVEGEEKTEKTKVKKKRRYYTINDVYDRLRQIESDKAEIRATSILLGLGFTREDLSKPTRDFSGGWRMRIALAGALFTQPDILLLDEPTNHLDLYALVWLENYLVEKWKKTLVIASHERDFLNSVVDSIIHLYGQKLTVYVGNYEHFNKARKANQAAIDARIDAQARAQKKMKESIVQSKDKKAAASKSRKLDKLEKDNVKKVEEDKLPRFQFLDPIPIQYPILTFSEVDFGFPGQPNLFSGLDFGIDLQSRVGLVGPNGAGKSTLMNLMYGTLEATAGHIYRNRHLKMAKFTQHHVEMLDLEKSAIDHLRTVFPDVPVQEVRNHLARFGLAGQLPTKQIKFLSGGQKSRVSFAEIAWNNPHILLLDEPSNHLDMETVEVLSKSLKEYKGGIVLISHSTRLLSRVCEEIWVVKDGKVVPFSGSFEDYKHDLIEEIGQAVEN